MVKVTYWESVLEVAKDWPLDGPVPKEELLTIWKWDYLKVNLLEQQGLAWRGESYKNQGWAVLMVLKVAKGSTPYVVFITEQNTRACMGRAIKMCEEGTLDLREDKYA